MDRETKKLNTPSGKEFEIKTYFTAKERNQLRSVYLSAMKFDIGADQPAATEISGAVIEQAESKLIELATVSYDGSAENILDRILDGEPGDYDFIVAEINKIGAGNFQRAK